mgnify:CR=1 FL=1
MKLTAYSNYALRILMYCALRQPDLSSVAEISEAYGISKAHLVKAAHQLVQIGYLDSVRGRAGGIRLAMAPEDIVIGEVVRHTEGDLMLVECFDPATNTCPLMEVCELSRTMKRARDAFLAVLDDTTLADVTANQRALSLRLNLLEDA